MFAPETDGGDSTGQTSDTDSDERRKGKRQRRFESTPGTKNAASIRGERVTFLVNLWFDWKPLGAERLPLSLAQTMMAARLPDGNLRPEKVEIVKWCGGSYGPAGNAAAGATVAAASSSTAETSEDQKPSHWVKRRFDQRGLRLEVAVPYPAMSTPPEAGSSLEIVFSDLTAIESHRSDETRAGDLPFVRIVPEDELSSSSEDDGEDEDDEGDEDDEDHDDDNGDGGISGKTE